MSNVPVLITNLISSCDDELVKIYAAAYMVNSHLPVHLLTSYQATTLDTLLDDIKGLLIKLAVKYESYD